MVNITREDRVKHITIHGGDMSAAAGVVEDENSSDIFDADVS